MDGLYDEIRLALHGVWQRRWLALAVAWGIALVGWALVALVPNSYQSSARIFVQLQSILPGKIGINPAEQQQGIDRVRQTLASAVNLEKVVRSTDLALQATSDADVAAAVERLRKSIEVKPGQDNVFTITATSSAGGFSDGQNARLSRAVVQKLIDIFVEQNLSDDRQETSQTLQFLDQQLKDREAQLQDAEQKRVEFQTKYMGMLPGVGSIDQRMESARSELGELESNLVAAQSSLAALNGQMAGTPATVAAPNIVINAGTPSGARGRIAQLNSDLAEYSAKGYTDQHPDVVEARAQIARLRGQAASEGRGGGGGGGGTTANPIYVSLRSMQAEKQATVAALTARRAQLQADMASFATKQAEEPGVSAEEARLTRDYQVLKDQYDKLLGDREDVRLRNDVQNQTDSVAFRVIDPPSLPRVPTAPNRPLFLALVLVVAIAGGIGAAFAKGRVQTTFATATRLAASSGMPVIGAVSEVVTATQRGEAARRLKWFGGGAGGLVAAFALLMVVEFVRRGTIA